MFSKFFADESGAVTVDWVVLTAAITGLGIASAAAVGTGVENLSGDVDGQLSTQTIAISFGDDSGDATEWSGQSAADYLAYGASLAPGNNGATYFHAQQAAAGDAPSGYNFDTPLMDPDSGNVVYTSDDGLNYSIGGEVHAVDGYGGTLNPFTA